MVIRPTVQTAGLPSFRKQAEQRFWLLMYAVLISLITMALGAAAFLFWWNSYSFAAPRVGAPLSAQPQIEIQLSMQESGGSSNSTSDHGLVPAEVNFIVAPTFEPTPEVTAQVESVAEPTKEAAVAQPTQVEIVVEPTPVVEATNPPEVIEEPTHRQIYLGLEDDYHSQLSAPVASSACGPTALLIALDYFDLQSSLSTIIAQSSFDPQAGGYDPTCTANAVCMSPQALVKLASEQYGLEVQYGEGWTFEQVYDALQAGGPVIADIAWDPSSSTLGHFVVIYGIDVENEVVYYHDPYSGAGLSATWDEFQYRWAQTVDVGDPVQPGGYYRWGMVIYMR